MRIMFDTCEINYYIYNIGVEAKKWDKNEVKINVYASSCYLDIYALTQFPHVIPY